MAKKPIPPTNGELEILRAMWRIGRKRTRSIHAAVNEDRKALSLPPLAFNTIATVLNKMVIKELARRFEEDATRHEYEAIFAEDDISRSVAGDVLRRFFRGSIFGFVQGAFREKKPSKDEIAKLQKLIDQSRGGGA
jgi:predicted transcriptional regulator